MTNSYGVEFADNAPIFHFQKLLRSMLGVLGSMPSPATDTVEEWGPDGSGITQEQE